MSRFATSFSLGPEAPEYPELAGKRVLVTGASNGVGHAIAQAYARQGCQLILQFDGASRTDFVFADTLREIAPALRVFDCTLSDEDAAQRLAATALRAFQGIDVLVHNVSAVPFDTGDARDLEAFDAAIADNLMIACGISEQVADAMRASATVGSIIYAAEVGKLTSDEAYARYAVAKVGLEAITQGQAWEFADDGIGVNALLAGPDAEHAEIASAAVYQATEDAFWISGKTLTFGT
ncbi:MAG: SDR family oxidoreductase [Pseudomonadota bacterium]